MLPDVLRDLQELDGQIARFLEQRNRNGLVAYEEECQALRSRWSQTVARLTELRMAMVERERQLEVVNQELALLEKELQGRLATYEESLLQSRIVPIQARKCGLEDELLEAMLAIEELQPQELPLSVKLAEAEQELSEALEDEKTRILALDQRLEDCRQRRQALLASLSSEIARAYEAALERDGTGLDAVKNGRCNRCRMQLPDQQQRQLRLSQPVICSTCQVVLIHTLVSDRGSR